MRFLRPESSLSIAKDEYGNLVWAGDRSGPVIHRTPEELGIPRVIPPDPPRRKEIRPDFVDSSRLSSGMRAAVRDKPRQQERRIVVPEKRSSQFTKRGVENMNGKQGGATAVSDRRVPSKRYAAPSIITVAMEQVPESATPERAPISAEIYRQLVGLPAGQALRVGFESDNHASYVRGKLRNLAKKDGRFVSSSRSADGKTRWFWLEKTQ